MPSMGNVESIWLLRDRNGFASISCVGQFRPDSSGMPNARTLEGSVWHTCSSTKVLLPMSLYAALPELCSSG